MKAIVLAAGKGTRMKGLCDTRPKPMLPLLNRPSLEYILRAVRDAGISEVLVVIGTHAEAIERHFGDGASLGLKVRYAYQHVPTGTGSAALLGREFAGREPFLLAFGDIIISRREYARLTRRYAERGAQTLLTTRSVPDPFRGAAVYVEGERVVRIIEKPKPGTSMTHFDNAGVFVFPPEVFEELAGLRKSPRGEYELTDAIHNLLAAGRDVRAFELQGVWHNLTGPEDLLAANAAVLGESGAASLLDPTARVGRAQIGDHTFIGPGCEVGDAAALDHCILLPKAHVGSEARVSYAILGEGAVVPGSGQVCGTAQDVKVLGDGTKA